MKILLIQPALPCENGISHKHRSALPLGLAYVAGALESVGHRVSVVDADLLGLGPTEVASRACELAPDAVGISAISTLIFPEMVQLARAIKAVLPVPIFIGGHQATAGHIAIIQDTPYVDYVVRGEGEETAVELMAALEERRPLESVLGITYRGADGQPCATPDRPVLSDLDRYAIPARHLFPSLDLYRTHYDVGMQRHRHHATLASSRGCPKSCSFCSIVTMYRKGAGKAWRPRAVESVVAEIRHLVHEFGVEALSFVDDNILVDPRRLIEIFSRLADEGIHLAFTVAGSADLVIRHQGALKRLAELGCVSIELGLESGSDEVLKRFDKRVTVEQNRQAVQLVRAAGMTVVPDFIMFEPEMSLQDFCDNLQFLEAAQLVGTFPDDYMFNTLTLLPGTPHRKRIEERTGQTALGYELLEYAFVDERVGRIQHAASVFVNAVRPRLLELAERFHDLRQEQTERTDEEIMSLMMGSLVARLCSFNFLRSLARAAQNGDLAFEGCWQKVRSTVRWLEDLHQSVGSAQVCREGAGRGELVGEEAM